MICCAGMLLEEELILLNVTLFFNVLVVQMGEGVRLLPLSKAQLGLMLAKLTADGNTI